MTKQKLPDFFYATIKVTMDTLLNSKTFGEEEILDVAWKKVKKRGLEQIKRIKKRQRIIDFYGIDVGYDFEFDYQYAWVDVDGIIQLLRLDLLPLMSRTIDAEIRWLNSGWVEKWNDKFQKYDTEEK